MVDAMYPRVGGVAFASLRVMRNLATLIFLCTLTAPAAARMVKDDAEAASAEADIASSATKPAWLRKLVAARGSRAATYDSDASSAGLATSNGSEAAPISFHLTPGIRPLSAQPGDWRVVSQRVLEGDEVEEFNTQAMFAAAERGEVAAMAGIGAASLLGRGMPWNFEWAVHWLSKAAAEGHPDAQALLGFLHSSDVLAALSPGADFQPNETLGRELTAEAAEGGSVLALMAWAMEASREGLPCVSAPRYEQAAEAAVQGLDEERLQTTEQSYPQDAEHMTLLSPSMPKRERMDTQTVETLDEAAAAGDALSQLHMGLLYHAGKHGVPRDWAVAQHWFREAAHRGDATARANLGLMAMRTRRYSEALRELRRAAQFGDPLGFAGLGYAYLHGAGVPKSEEKAERFLCLAALKGNLEAIYNLGAMAEAKKAGSGYNLLFEAARYSHPLAQLVLGRKALQNRDCDSATVFLKLAAEAGPLVRSMMGSGLRAAERGKSKQALLYYLLAAHAGVEVAQQNAAHLYLHELPKRPELETLRSQRAKDLFRLAARQGSADAEVQLGNMLVDSEDYATAAEMYRDAARKGSKDALFHMGNLYWRGKGVDEDKNKALQLWHESDFQSKHARLRGVHGALARTAQWASKSNDALLLAAGLGFLVAKGGEVPGLADLLRGGNKVGAGWDEEDMFAMD